MTDIQITRFEQSHVQAVAQIEQACFADPWTEDGLREELDNSCARFLTAVTADGTVAGYIGCHTVLDEGYIANVAVSPVYSQTGHRQTACPDAAGAFRRSCVCHTGGSRV